MTQGKAAFLLTIDKKFLWFRKKNIWFADEPFNLEDADAVHFYACRNKVDMPDFECAASDTLVVDLTRPLDAIWRNMGKKSCRYYINRSKRFDLEIRLNQGYDAYYNMYKTFIRAKGFKTTAESPLFMRKYCTLFTAWQHGEILSGALMIEDETTMRWLFGGSKRMEKTGPEEKLLISCATRLLIWEAIQHAKRKGRTEFDLGGYYSGNNHRDPRYGINRFKEKFGGNKKTYYTYFRAYSRIYRCMRLLRSLAGPIQRA